MECSLENSKYRICGTEKWSVRDLRFLMLRYEGCVERAIKSNHNFIRVFFRNFGARVLFIFVLILRRINRL